jgi:hypothetical protein
MPFNIPDNNTKTGNGKELYVPLSGNSIIDGNITIEQDLTVIGNLLATEGNILDALNVGNLLVAPTINGAGTSAPVKPVSFPMGLSLSPTVYTSTFQFSTALNNAPATFSPALPAPSAQSAGVYAMTGVASYVAAIGGPFRYLISGTFINNGTYWVGNATPLQAPSIMQVFTQPNFVANPLGTPILVDAGAPLGTTTCVLNLYKISNVVGVSN